MQEEEEDNNKLRSYRECHVYVYMCLHADRRERKREHPRGLCRNVYYISCASGLTLLTRAWEYNTYLYYVVSVR